MTLDQSIANFEMDQQELESQVEVLRAQVEAANTLIGLLIGNLERCAPYNLLLTIEGELNESQKSTERDKDSQVQAEAKRAFVEYALKLGSSLKYKPFRFN